MKRKLLNILKNKVLLMDGAMGSLLSERGLKPGESPEKWNIENEDEVKQIYRDYFNAGSDIIQTNTFGGNRIKLEKYGLGEKTFEINKKAAEIAVDVKPKGKYVCGSIGPSGEFFATKGEFPFNDYVEMFKEQTEALLEGGVDLINIETMYNIYELTAAVKSVRIISDEIPLIACMTFNPTSSGFKTMMGISVEQFVNEMENMNVSIIGTNCSLDSREMIPLAKKLRTLTKLPVLIKPNAGQPVIREGKVKYCTTPDKFTEDVKEILQTGINLIGGCCGTDPSYIEKLRETVDIYNNKLEEKCSKQRNLKYDY